MRRLTVLRLAVGGGVGGICAFTAVATGVFVAAGEPIAAAATGTIATLDGIVAAMILKDNRRD